MHARRNGPLAVALVVLLIDPSVITLAGGSQGAAALAADTPAEITVDHPSLALPSGAAQCPDSGAAASCATTVPEPVPGQPFLPAGARACPSTPSKPALGPAASCDEVVLDAVPAASVRPGLSGSATRVQPSVPVESLGPRNLAFERVSLVASQGAVPSGQRVTLVATATSSVTGTLSAIEIFDQSTGVLVGACMKASRCMVDYASSGGTHRFAAYVTPPTNSVPNVANAGRSNTVSVSWLGITLAADSPAVIGPGERVNVTAKSSVDVASLGYILGMYDKTTGKNLTYCSQGTSCSTSVAQGVAGQHALAGYVAAAPAAQGLPDIQVESKPLVAVWLGVTLVADSTYPSAGGTVYLTAQANTDMRGTPWSIGIYDHTGHLVAEPCKSGDACTAAVTVPKGTSPTYIAVVGAEPPAVQAATPAGQVLNKVMKLGSLLNVQARSLAVKPTKLLWGVDSCKRLTGDGAAAGGLYPQVRSRYRGAPDFWGRYLTNTYNCPGLSSTEIAAAAGRNLGILPIYNDYDCSAVAGYGTGSSYGQAATAAAAAKGIPAGTGVVIDIEPPGPWCSGAIDAGFVRGWYDAVSQAGYAPAYYGDSTAGSTFARAWCTAIWNRPEIATNSYIWSFQPSLTGRFTRLTAPRWAPHAIGCAGRIVAWQYVLSSGATPDVDSDEALSSLPIWYP
jgi:hypothetical protein